MNRKRLLIIALGILFLVISGLALGKKHQPTQLKTTEPKTLYIALGDSVASGQGLKTDSDSSACYRTDEAYPHIVAKELNFKLNSFACSGAKIDVGIIGPQDVNELIVDSQLNQLYKGDKPELITITVGANDADWLTTIGKCLASNCGTAQDSAGVQLSIIKMQEQFNKMLVDINAHYENKPPKVIVSGYYHIFPTTKVNCDTSYSIDSAEINWLNQQADLLNQSIKNVVTNYGFVHFADVDFTGHELCTADPWIQDLLAKTPFHPSEDGQNAIAKSVIKAFK